MQVLLSEIGIFETVIEDNYPRTIAPPILIYADNQRAIKFTENSEYQRKTKHIPIKYHKTCELDDNAMIQFKWILTSEIVVDGFTKLLQAKKFKKFIFIPGLVDC